MNYRMEQLDGFTVVGIQERVHMDKAFQQVPAMWEKAMNEGLLGRLLEIGESRHPMGGILGVCADGDWGKNEEFLYMLSIVSGGQALPGMISRDFPAATWAVFEAEGPPDTLQEVWRRLYTEWVPASAYELAYLPAVECYLPPEQNRNELWVPVVKKRVGP